MPKVAEVPGKSIPQGGYSAFLPAPFEPRDRVDGGENVADFAKSHDVPLKNCVPGASALV
jgi:hypothetical protein